MDMERKSLLNSGQHQRTVHFATVRCWFSKVAISSRNVKPTLGNQNEHEVFIHLAAFLKITGIVLFISITLHDRRDYLDATFCAVSQRKIRGCTWRDLTVISRLIEN